MFNLIGVIQRRRVVEYSCLQTVVSLSAQGSPHMLLRVTSPVTGPQLIDSNDLMP